MGALIPLAVPFLAQGEIGAVGMVARAGGVGDGRGREPLLHERRAGAGRGAGRRPRALLPAADDVRRDRGGRGPAVVVAGAGGARTRDDAGVRRTWIRRQPADPGPRATYPRADVPRDVPVAPTPSSCRSLPALPRPGGPGRPGQDRPALRRPVPDLRANSPPSPAPWPARSARRAGSPSGPRPPWRPRVAVVAALLAGAPAVPLNPKSARASWRTSSSDSAPSLVLAEPGDRTSRRARARWRASTSTYDAAAPVAATRPHRRTWTSPEIPRPDRLHLRHHRPAQGRRPPPPGHRRHPGRPGGRLAVDRRRRAGARPAAVPRARPDPGRPRPAAPRRNGAPPGPVRHRRGGKGADGEGATMLFGVPTMYHRIAEALARRPGLAKALGGRGCWCPVRRRCPCTTTSGSRRRPAGGSSSGTG